MTKNQQEGEMNRLLCEKVLNESWSKVERYTNEIRSALEKDKLNQRDLLLIKVAARAFVQRAMLEQADSLALFGIDLYTSSPCGFNPSCDICDRFVCRLIED